MAKKKKILVIDDDESVLNMLSVLLKKEGYDVAVSESGDKALKALDGSDFKGVLCDIRMPKVDGLEVLKRARAKGVKSPFIMMSAYGAVENAVEAMKLGAYDYLNKPFQPEEVLIRLRLAEERDHLLKENVALTEKIQGEYNFDNVVAKSKEMLKIFEVIRKVADYKSTILITGESGTGKDLIARTIHFNSSRKDEPFLPINCGAIPENLLESELFGHLKGSFTGATSDKEGLFEAADGGTLFLDEIGEMPLNLQVKLLRVIQEGEIYRIGDTKPIEIDVRLVAATAKDLEEEARAGRFREDLFYRLNVIHIRIPSLRERKEDVPLLIDHLVRKFNDRLGKSIKGITPRTLKAFVENDWKGNVREMENVLERAMIMIEGDKIDLEHVPMLAGAGGAPEGGKQRGDRRGRGAETQVEEDPEGLKEWRGLINTISGMLRKGEISIPGLEEELERGLIQVALQKCNWNRSRAAGILGISRRALFYKMKSFGLD